MLDKHELEAMYREKLSELEQERDKLGDMYEERVSDGKPLTDNGILRQNESCANISLEITQLKKMLDEIEE